MIIDCRLLCYNSELDDLGISMEKWLRFSIDSKETMGVKETDDDSCDSVIFMKSGDSFVINKAYDYINKILHDEM